MPVVARLNGSVAYFSAEAGVRVPRLTATLERWSLRRADAWAAASRYVAERTREVFGLPLAPTTILYNPVELPPPVPETTRVPGRVVFSGRLIAKKEIGLPRPRDLDVTYTEEFTALVHELREHIGRVRKS